MGFPQWTLWGMAIAGFTAVILLGYSLYSQSPRTRARAGIEPYKLDARIRRLTAISFAALLILMGFFLAGVPLDEPTVAGTSGAFNTSTTSDDSESAAAAVGTSNSGAFGGPPTSQADTESADSAIAVVAPSPTLPIDGASETSTDDALAESVTPEAAAATPDSIADPTQEPTPTNTPTPTPSPTPTPKPTLTPTPIEDPVSAINTGGSTLWVRRSPGGANIALVRDGDIVILRSGRANRDGVLWQEIMTVEGVTGWVQTEFLASDDVNG